MRRVREIVYKYGNIWLVRLVPVSAGKIKEVMLEACFCAKAGSLNMMVRVGDVFSIDCCIS